ncbi:aconitate hydratase 1 [Fusarium pseudocircinatum]|uniref:Aconitate hydratase, mitochondrial n=1 Tax=Fusarium pseudocircinatum TaxID=56676 RepID=A0A8H5URJ1_9HYPO|nr:aconitate hydratase 1 [Fusarium pseudocircinatum]
MALTASRLSLRRVYSARQRPLAQARRCLATHSSHIALSPLEPYNALDYTSRLESLRRVQGTNKRPLTLSEKLLYSHLIHDNDDWVLDQIERGKTILRLRPDRVACHDATATMALLQFISAGLPRVQVPTSVHSDHLIVAEYGSEKDLERAAGDHREVYAFLSSAAKKYGIGYWKPGAGIIHITIFENYAFPGGLFIGTDSHTPNAGGMGVLGIGVGGSDAVDAMAGMPWELVCPKVLGVRLTGRLSGWASSKDIICKLAGILTVSGGKGKVIEFFGPGAGTLGATAMATVCNMSAEVGSTSCIFPYSQAMARYLTATKRGDIARYADGFTETLLTADRGSEDYYDEVIEIDLSTLEPHINGPFTPDLSHSLSQFKTRVQESSWPSKISHSMVGSCTNSSYEDLEKVYDLVQQAKKAGIDRPRTPFLVSPGSEQIRATAEESGILPSLREAGAVVLSNSCGPCVGQWDRKDVDVAGAENNSVISSFNRNFTGRHDGNPATHSFVTSPEIATAFAYAGDLSFNPMHDAIPTDKSGVSHFRFTPPVANELPESFVAGSDLFQPPVLEDTSDYKVAIDKGSDRLELLTPFEPWKPGQAENMQVLIKVSGKCTTDHISPAGPWYNYRGHLSNISHNMLLGATNGFLPDANSLSMTGKTRDPTDGTIKFIHKAARTMKNAGIRWCIIGDNNYGEGSSREHAALEPRFLGGVAVIAKSFARIHETNLKKQGMFPLTFADPLDYDKIQEGDVISLLDVDGDALQPEKQVTMKVVNKDGTEWTAQLNHSYHAHQLAWLRAGSALNHVKKTILGSAAQRLTTAKVIHNIIWAQSHKMNWQAIAKQSQTKVLNSIPDRWRLDVNQYQDLKDVTNVPYTCGLLTEEQLRITELTATEIVKELEARDLKAVQVLEAFAGRAGIAHQLVNCLTEWFYEEGLAHARELDEALEQGGQLKGLLHGVPIALKDIHCVAGHASTMAFVSGRNNIVSQDSAVVATLRAEGAIFFCKTTMPQSAMAIETVSNLWGRTLNPYNRDLNAGGSSGGDAVLVAMKGTPLTPSTDLGGSIRVPAAFNGLYALKPTATRIPKGGMPDLGQSLIQVSFGPICHSIQDIELLTRVTNAHPYNRFDVTSVPVPWRAINSPEGKLKIGLMEWDGVVMPHPPILRGLEHSKQLLIATGHEVVDFKPPFDCWQALKTTFDIYYQGGADATIAALEESGEPLIPAFADLLKVFNVRKLPASEILQLGSKLRDYKEQFLAAWDETAKDGRPIDALICPPAPGVGYPHDFNTYWGYTSLLNLIDYPAAILPVPGLKISSELDLLDSKYVPLDTNPYDKPNHEIYDPNLFENQAICIQVVGRPFQDEELIQVTSTLDALLHSL